MDTSAIERIFTQSQLVANEAEASQLAKIAKENNESFISVVAKAKKINFLDIALMLSNKFQLSFLDLDAFDVSLIPSDIDIKNIEKYKFFPLKKVGNNVVLAVSDPTIDLSSLKFSLAVNQIQIIIVEENKLIACIAKLLQDRGVNFGNDINFEGELDVVNEEEQQTNADTDVEDAPVVKFITATLLDAVRQKVSDIHFEPYEKTYRIRFRLDGALFEYKTAPPVLKDKIASRIKVISKLDISEKRVPQDGRLKLKISADRTIDFRVSTLPTLWGEKIVMRILDSSASALDIDKLGYDSDQKERLLEAVKRPYGMVLVTGPTGSGKTVSLYSCINILNQEDVNICTAEDPSEINLPGVNQVNMNEKAGLTFAATLKSFLRQDPDTILVGEIRDLETADIAIKAAQTGHMVLSTLHTNDAPKTITRLLNMGVKPFNIASSVILITAQRLGRRLCSVCKEKEQLPPEILLESGLPPEELQGYGSTWHTYRPVGCPECANKGYKGRVGIYQVMPITEDIRKIILREGTDIEIAEEAKRIGVLSLREAGLQKVKQGITSLEEVNAVTNLN